MRLDGGKRRWPICQTDGSDKTTQAQIAQRLLRGRWESTNNWPVRTDPPANEPGDQRTACAAKRQCDRPNLQAEHPPSMPTAIPAARKAMSEWSV